MNLPNISNISANYYLAAGMACARRILEKLDTHWDGPEEGMNRPTMSARETEGLDILNHEAYALGMEAYELLSGSRIFIYRGEDPTLAPEIVNSHIDSVRKAGRYDGPAGIVLGFAAITNIHQRFLETGVRPARTMIVLADRGEESTEFNQFGIPSGMNAAKFGPEILDTVRIGTDKTWAEYAREMGLNVDALCEKLASRTQLIPFELVHSQWEAHIEQGSKLADAGVSLGIVDAFRGNVRYSGKIEFKGRADHTGATEMEDRLDAGDAVADFREIVKREAEALRQAGHDLVYTFHFSTDDNRTAIPENASIAVEARSTSQATLDVFEQIVEAAIKAQEAKGFEAKRNTNKIKRTAPVSLDAECQKIIKEVAASLNITTMPMASGAGHDLMNYAPYTSCGFILFGHGNRGVSHNPGEILGLTPDQDPFVEGNYPLAVAVMTDILTREERMPSQSPRSIASADFTTELVKRGARRIMPSA